MNDPLPATNASSSHEKQRSFIRRIWHKFIHFISPPADAAALREVVAELMEEPVSASGISHSERILLSNIMRLRERKVADCMVPRADIVALAVNASIKELVASMTENGYSRVPIYRGTLDDVVGMAHVKDIIPALVQQKPCVITDILRPVLYVAPSMPASKLLLQMRQTRQHMAVVIDEFGGVDGLVTIEDLVEEIVGEIDDEHDDPESASVIVRPDGALLADARMDIDSFEKQTGLNLPRLEGDDVDTLGGYVAHMAGRVPSVGESFCTTSGLGMTVVEMDQSRVSRVNIRIPRQQESR